MKNISKRRKQSLTIDIDILERLKKTSEYFGISMSEFVNTILKRYDNAWMWKEFQLIYDKRFKERFGKYPDQVGNTKELHKYNELLRDKRTRKRIKKI